MKNKFILLFVCFICILFVGCKKKTYNIEELRQYVINSVHAYEGDANDAGEVVYYVNVANDVNLPIFDEKKEGTKITWRSLDSSCIEDDGHIVDRDSKKILDIDFECIIEYNGESSYIPFIFRLTSISLETAALRFEAQLPSVIFEDRTFVCIYDSIINVSWTSSNEEAFSNEGKYTKLSNDSETIITFIASDSNSKYESSKTIKVLGKTYVDLYNECEEWVKGVAISDTYLKDNITLPTKYEGKVDLEWTSSDKNVMENDGTIHKTYYERYVYLKCKISIEDHTSEFKLIMCVAPLEKNVSDKELIEELANNVARKEISKREFSVYGNINQYYGFLPFYYNENANITEYIAPETNDNRPGIQKTSIEYVCVHDTANNSKSANALMHAKYITDGGEGTSWHYTVDENGAYHQIPDEEVAWHAGDSNRYYGLVDTGIKATSTRPSVYIKNGNFYILGIDTKIRPYSDQVGTTFESEDYEDKDICELGITVEIGDNGNYWLGKTYYNKTYKRIANFGGNYNSIGIETCVNSGSDYGHTFRNVAKLCAELCIANNLDVYRVKGHHFFSGKPCPNATLTSGYWCDFLNLISMEKFAKENLSAYQFKWTSLSENLDNNGYISLKVNANEELQYKLEVYNNENLIYSNNFKTIIK